MSHNRITLDLAHVSRWPPALKDFLDSHYALFNRWEIDARDCDPKAYDRAIYGLRDALDPYVLTGWHCTRLTAHEMSTIETTGLHLPTANILHERIERLVHDGPLTPNLGLRLKCRHQAADNNRAGRFWFCFFPPRLAGEDGIHRFFRHWGGEALYNSHEDDPVTSPALQAIGCPALIEADVPIDALAKHGGLTFKVVRRYLIHRGLKTRERVDHEDRMIRALPPEFIRRVIRFPDPAFLELTGCAEWDTPLAPR